MMNPWWTEEDKWTEEDVMKVITDVTLEIQGQMVRVIEECSELIQAICRAGRFGFLNRRLERSDLNNLKEIKAEIADMVRECLALDRILSLVSSDGATEEGD